ncbi:stromal membrane-associated protein [Cryptococcus neoformans A1-35-8]|nr:stromal membrane-associated protein [Cryptococcus neoformans var. grubii A5-35-17]OXH01191.1 stromal membrane-associated protein [Cryptococcus neoformans var. grubii A1-35-8]
MSRQDKATTERNARILRDLVKQPENKSCADCKRNGPFPPPSVMCQADEEEKTHDGHRGTWDCICASGARVSIGRWGRISAR